MENKSKKSLLERYGIPIHHLDFKYIKECQDGREMEKIVHILRSNEEGYFPDLTNCAEEKLKELKPQSRLFRVEGKIKGREALDPNEIKPIYDWNQDVKRTEKQLLNLVKDNDLENTNKLQMPPIRTGGRILQTQNNNEKLAKTENSKKECQRIKSTDYNKWDKYDAEEEILRLELAEEREVEEVERKNRLNMEKCVKKQPLTITEITDEEKMDKPLDKWSNLTDIEREKLSEEYRLRGNEYFRSKEFDNALEEYSRAIQVCPGKAVAAYNNRALTYFKQQRFLDSIKDCEECLRLEPINLKARLRLAEANYAYGRKRESYQLYINVLQLDAMNSVALRATNELRKQFEDLPPPNATRLKIQDESSKSKATITKETLRPQPKPKEYDLAELIKPNRLVKNKFIKAAENLGKNIKNSNNNTKNPEKKVAQDTIKEPSPQIKLPSTFLANPELKGKKLIQEL